MEKERKTPTSKLIAAERWAAKNKDKRKYIMAKSTAKRFITRLADQEDLLLFQELIKHTLNFNETGKVKANINFKDEDDQTYNANFKLEQQEEDETGVAALDVFRTHPNEEGTPYIDMDHDLVSNYEAYYLNGDIITPENIEKWFKDELATEFGKIEIEGNIADCIEYE